MPEMDGLTCTRQWRQDSNNQDPEYAIMALSANTASEEIVLCKQAGMHHYLTKPVTLAHLADGISIAAEYQLQREIDLQEQDNLTDKAIIDITHPSMRRKIRRALSELLSSIEQNSSDQKKNITLLHTLKGCIGQAGLGPLLCDVIDMENRVKRGLPLSNAEIAELRLTLDVALRLKCSP